MMSNFWDRAKGILDKEKERSHKNFSDRMARYKGKFITDFGVDIPVGNPEEIDIQYEYGITKREAIPFKFRTTTIYAYQWDHAWIIFNKITNKYSHVSNHHYGDDSYKDGKFSAGDLYQACVEVSAP